MSEIVHGTGDRLKIEVEELGSLITKLAEYGYSVIGPTIRQSAIVYDEVTSLDDLPIGYTDDQEGGSYRLKKRGDEAVFGYNSGPHSWKRFLHPPVRRLWKSMKNETGFEIQEEKPSPVKYAFLGVRSCDLHAILVQDAVFTGGKYTDNSYKSLRENSLIIAVNCSQASGTCFCVSMNTGPRVRSDFDIALTEILGKDEHYFFVEIGSGKGAEIISSLNHRIADDKDESKANEIVDNTARQMGRTMETEGIKELLYRNYENPRWDEVADRCLSCTNCTMVCPTCFCTTVEDITDLTGENAERVQKWDSCFTMDFSYVHGGVIRSSTRSRYRQWMTHKLATWIDQFGTSGCVGCGRCITWCPVAIDITEEVRAIRESEKEG